TTLGLKELETQSGLDIFVNSLKSELTQIIVLTTTEPQKLRKTLNYNEDKIKSEEEKKEENNIAELIDNDELIDNKVNEEDLFQKIQSDLVKVASLILKIKEKDICSDDDMNEYGFDSISFTEFSNQLNEKYKLEITPTIFFEHSTLDSVASYLFKKHKKEFITYYYDNLKKILSKRYTEKSSLYSFNEPELRSRFQKSMVKNEQRANEPIAVIGMSGVMPQSDDLLSFWKHLEAGDDLITEIPKDRWNWEDYYGDPLREVNKTNIKWGGFMKEVDKFDTFFFKISPHEASLMDPQQKIFLETVWKAIEDAGYKPSALSGTKTGLFVGVASIDYYELLKEYGIAIEAYTSTGTLHSILANRISYLLNLHGPSEPIDTACSSSLVAIHRAIKAIQNGECRMAIAGGVNVILTPTLYISFNKAGMLSEDGRCKTFDKLANGYIRGEGAGAILLKSLGEAQADGDHIYALIKGSAVNHGGHVNSLTAPDPNAQAEVIINAYEEAQIDPDTVAYIETHGTGTSLGDPIEINGLKTAFEELYRKKDKKLIKKAYCGIGSVKTNIGHLETAAGITGVIKVILSMKYRKLSATIHQRELNPYIQLQGSPFYIVAESKPWERLRDENNQAIPRRCGVSSFGFGGVNAHVVLEEYENLCLPLQDQGPQLVVLSAKNEERLKDYSRKMSDFLKDSTNIPLVDIAYTLQVGREAMEERLAVVVADLKELIELLIWYGHGETNIDNFYGDDHRFGQATDGGTGVSPVQHTGRMPVSPHGPNEDHGHFYQGNVADKKTINSLFVKGRAGREFIKIILNDRDFSTLAKLWISGVDIDWSLLYINEKPHRISLPTYPFARERYWVPVPDSKAMNRIKDQKTEYNPKDKEGIIEDKDIVEDRDIIQKLMDIVSKKTDIDLKAINPETNLSEYGVDSISKLQIINDIINNFAYLSNDEDGDKLLLCPSISNLRDYIIKNKNETENSLSHFSHLTDDIKVSSENQTENINDSRIELDEFNINQKKDIKNIICNSIKVLSDNPLSITGRMVIDEGHSFFFDHSLDHISGMQITEAMNEVVKTAYLYKYRLMPDNPIFIKEIDVSFNSFCKKNIESLVRLTQEVKEENEKNIYFQTEILQENDIVAKGKYILSQEPVNTIRIPKGHEGREGNEDHGCLNHIEPCDKKIVNKNNPENVLISHVLRDEKSKEIGCWLLFSNKHRFFGDFAGAYVDSIVLLEACRQSFRAFTEYLQEQKEIEPIYNSKIMGILKSHNIVLARLISKDEQIYLRKKTLDIIKV
ncbi:MAG: hypothetical protein QG635_1148, partial [Bacteroidota bacterium]|nr:hypothetical protein [Bacteroidota bacterium]